MSHWKDKKVLVSGGSGFIGKRLCKALLDAGAMVDSPSSDVIDLTEPQDAKFWAMSNAPFDVCFHLAAVVGGIDFNRNNASALIFDNLMMGLNVIDACARAYGAKIVFVGSVCSYPRNIPMPMIEKNLWEGYPEESNAPYGIAKKAIGETLRAYHQDGHIKAAAYPLMTNCYGPGDDFDLNTSHVIPALIRKFVHAKRSGLQDVTLWGTGRASRDFIYVDDAVKGIMLSGEKVDVPRPFNLGSGHEVTISWIAGEIAQVVGYEGHITWDATMPDGQPRRSLDPRLSKHMLEWGPGVVLQDGIARTVAWYDSKEKDE